MTKEILFESERLQLRPFHVDDAAGMLELNNNPDVLRFTGDPPFGSLEATRDFIQAYDHYQHHGYGRWTVLSKASGAYIGWCGLRMDSDTSMVDLGYRILLSEQGKGYATEAGQACLKYGFEVLELPFIVGRVMDGNNASIRVLEKLGMHYVEKTTCASEPALLYRIDRA